MAIRSNKRDDQLDPADTVSGGAFGHWLRRALHVLLALVPVVYYDAVPAVRQHIPEFPSPATLAILTALLLLCVEVLRLRYGFVVVGQREYERRRISGAAWSVIGGLVVLFGGHLVVPEAARELAYPVFLCAGLIDPVAGELRRRRASPAARITTTAILAAAIWSGCVLALGTPPAAMVAAVPITVCVEGPRTAPVDDNLTLLVIPWAAAATVLRVL